MKFQWVRFGDGLLTRGLYKLPAIGPGDAILVFAVTSGHRITPSGVQLLPWGSDLDAAVIALADELERVDPATDTVRREEFQVHR